MQTGVDSERNDNKSLVGDASVFFEQIGVQTDAPSGRGDSEGVVTKG